MGYAAKVVKDSIGPNGIRLTTLEVTFPRIVLSEFNTHRNFSRNSSSSRAIPVEKMLKKVMDDPFIPIYWGLNQRGMSAESELNSEEQVHAETIWLRARDKSVASVKELLELGIHKQITNRLLEPFLFHTVLVTSTEWPNWDNLRDHKDAQPEIQRAARLMKEARLASTPQVLKTGEWHLPLVEDYDQLLIEGYTVEQIVRICVGRCCRVSYLTHNGVRDPKEDLKLADRLQISGHMSPFEHPAMCLTQHETQWSGNFRGWLQLRKTIPNEAVFQRPEEEDGS